MNKKGTSYNKERLTIFVPEGKGSELKINALKAGKTLSEYITFMGTANLDDIINFIKNIRRK